MIRIENEHIAGLIWKTGTGREQADLGVEIRGRAAGPFEDDSLSRAVGREFGSQLSVDTRSQRGEVVMESKLHYNRD